MAIITTVEKIEQRLESLKGKNIVVTGGCFDLLHIGHITLLENAKKAGDILVVLLESDESIKKRKGINRPIHNQEQRAKLLSALRAVDFIILLPQDMSNDDYDALLEKIRPSIIATTEHDPFIQHKQRQAKKVGATIVEVNKYIPSVSTTKLLDVLSKEI